MEFFFFFYWEICRIMVTYYMIIYTARYWFVIPWNLLFWDGCQNVYRIRINFLFISFLWSLLWSLIIRAMLYYSLWLSDAIRCHRISLSLCHLMTCCLFNEKPLLQSMLTCCQLNLKEHPIVKLKSKYKISSQQNKFDGFVRKMSAILFWPLCNK